jgi:hypothetical protein
VKNCKAKRGFGEGPTGYSYALPTKDECIFTLKLPVVKYHVERFISFAMQHPTENFFITQIGCGLAGYTKEQIAPVFKGAPDNCVFPIEWKEIMESTND